MKGSPRKPNLLVKNAHGGNELTTDFLKNKENTEWFLAARISAPCGPN
jgi:hypothetical protein